MDHLSLGVISQSRKENERRLAIHPLHVERIEADLRERVYLERGYGERFGVPDEQLAHCVAGLGTREQLFAGCDVILLPKPQPQDLAQMREGQVLWGWPHCVQDEEITQLSVDQRLTLIAFEAMNYWSADGSSACTSFTRTTSWPVTARCCMPWGSSGRRANMVAGCGRPSSASGPQAGVR